MRNYKNWLAWYHLTSLINWQENADIWAKINDGSLADLIMKEVELLYDNIVKNNIKIEP
ncbi:hypothetical protein [Moraxella cuniculi]|uniref:Uncharacterized protein n=1 Tax=Moraxella cuniculi TaxID=34061 RepID=A0A448GY03_9GAMM|nr:hypothetical protein [Moraxella cuniculi]VEG13642.1 Uncharacterised protein [Moraxella cuniculi]